MSKAKSIDRSRNLLADIETQLQEPAILADLQRALVLLEDAMECGDPGESQLAENIGETYSDALFQRISHRLGEPSKLTEPELRQYFEVLNTIEKSPFSLPKEARETKIALVEGLIDIWFEGHPPQAKAKAMQQLFKISDESRK